MPAWQEGGCYGVKVVNIAPGNAARGLPGLHSTYVLYDARTGVPLAWIDGDEITARRTAATSALAASWLAPAGASHLAVIGAGRIARLLPEAHRVVRPIERVTVWARSPARADAARRRARRAGLRRARRAERRGRRRRGRHRQLRDAGARAGRLRPLARAGQPPRPHRLVHAGDARGRRRVLRRGPGDRRQRRRGDQERRPDRTARARRRRPR